MRRLGIPVTLAVFAVLLASSSFAQQASTITVPNLIRYGGTLRDTSGSPIASGTVGVTFAIYKQQDGGAPVWMETQNVTTDAAGNYSALLGHTTANGLPADLFSQQEQRWLGVEVEGQAEQPRVLLVSVPYAFKAYEAETLGGKSLSDFVLAKGATSSANGAGGSASSSANNPPASSGVRKGAASSGPTNFSGSTTDQIVGVTQSGTGAGINASGPTLGIKGTASAASGTAYGVQGVANSTAGVGLIGTATSTTGSTYGLRGTSSSSSGTGVRGIATATSGSTTGVSGYVASTSGVAGAFNNAAGGKIISGQNNGVEKFAVDGSGNVTTSGTINTTGLSGTTSAPTGVGLTGDATNTTGANTGVLGKSESSQGTGVSGITSALSGANIGVYGQSASSAGWGVYGLSQAGTGQAIGVEGVANSSGQNSAGVLGYQNSATGQVYGVNGQAYSATSNAAGVSGYEGATSGQVYGVSGATASITNYASGVAGTAQGDSGVIYGVSGVTNSTTQNAAGVNGYAQGTNGQVYGVSGDSQSNGANAAGVNGYAASTFGQVFGVVGSTPSTNGTGIAGNSTASSGNTVGVYGGSSSTSGNGVIGQATASSGVNFGVQGIGASTQGVGVQGSSPNVAVAGFNQTCNSSGCTLVTGTAGQFVTAVGGTLLQGLSGSGFQQVFSVDSHGNGTYAGNLNVSGTLTKGGGSFKIDDPLDPENKYLSHSFVESPDMLDLYNGSVKLDARGEAWVTMPVYFQVLNRDFQYVLTSVGSSQPRLYIAREIKGNRFKIAGGRPYGKVSWMVTGIRQDPWANAHRIPNEEDKPVQERGTYLHPELYGASGDKNTDAALRH